MDTLLPIAESRSGTFDVAAFLAKAGLGRKIVQLKPKQLFFSQGDTADAIFYLQTGRAKLTIVSPDGKEATISLLAAGEFVGEEALASVGELHLATATAITDCTALKIEREEMICVMHEEHSFSDLFLKFLLARSMRTQSDLVYQLFNSSERRLARILLLMAEFGEPGEPEPLIPPITQETLAEMIGTTPSRVSFFMNRFRKLGLIEYNGRIRVHKSLLNVVLHDQFVMEAPFPFRHNPTSYNAPRFGLPKPTRSSSESGKLKYPRTQPRRNHGPSQPLRTHGDAIDSSSSFLGMRSVCHYARRSAPCGGFQIRRDLGR